MSPLPDVCPTCTLRPVTRGLAYGQPVAYMCGRGHIWAESPEAAECFERHLAVAVVMRSAVAAASERN